MEATIATTQIQTSIITTVQVIIINLLKETTNTNRMRDIQEMIEVNQKIETSLWIENHLRIGGQQME